MTTKGGDVVVLVMPGVPVVYLGKVLNDGEGLDTIKERFTISMRRHALADAKALASADGRILQWINGDNEPSPWPEA
ncbi:MAG TPA: hypothetical protein VL919_11770 [Vicinamibacterales bacterium]|nr:hypothetical protein [Vicinamibacterales bacterium]